MACDYKFILGDKLPTIYDAAIAVHSVAKGTQSCSRTTAIHKYALALREMWVKSFTEKHVIHLNSVKKRLVGIMKDYDNKVYKPCCKGRRANDLHCSTIRNLNKIWRSAEVVCKYSNNNALFHAQTNNDLLDMGKDTHLLKGNEKEFYKEQYSTRLSRLSEEIDSEFEEACARSRDLDEERRQLEESEIACSNAPEYEEVIGKSVRKSSSVRVDEKSVQTEDEFINFRPEIRTGRNTLHHVKDTIASVSYRAAISVAKARVATQTVCQRFYGHIYHLSPPQNPLPAIIEGVEETEPLSKKPRTAKDYVAYRYVLPSEKSISTFKPLKSLSQEMDAAEAIMQKDGDCKITLHYDTTTRSRLEGEWPSLILNILSEDPAKCRFIPLRALFFAFEDRQQIIKLVVETLQRLAVASGNRATPKELWEKIDAFMSDAV